ncbi:hypothetical protein SLEP1_g2431 [Rubroshorea leprosula]|uniref:Uncharacterized protein n=1 Tax=Rubroshorea leprosula TaxID=152421 RepID=A0AAV5HN53_9ROSI|nr:hypothetical protein SLEP1_g2431 [Rubroshorea leprosula]
MVSFCILTLTETQCPFSGMKEMNSEGLLGDKKKGPGVGF